MQRCAFKSQSMSQGSLNFKLEVRNSVNLKKNSQVGLGSLNLIAKPQDEFKPKGKFEFFIGFFIFYKL